MAKRLFVCHAKSAIESTSEAVDTLENALDFAESSLFTSSLPGYSSDTRSEEELHSMLAGTSLVLALLTEASVEDQEFSFELGAAWSLGIEIVPVLLGDTHPLQRPWPLREYRVVRGDEPGAWDELIADVADRLGVPVRPPEAAIETTPPPSAEQPPSASEPVSEAELVFGSSVSIAPVVRLQEPESTPAVSQTIPPLTSDVFSRLPTCEMSLEAGRAVADCIFNRAEITNFESELAAPLGPFVDALGGSWSELRKMEDLDVWVGATENLLGTLPPKLEKVSEWYRLGFELSNLHNLAGQFVFDANAEAEQQWRVALDRFLTRCENARIGYENLGRVLSLLENLAGPSSERDLTNIGRSLEEVRRYAAGADGIHTAA
jgi:phage FluMu protein gp41